MHRVLTAALVTACATTARTPAPRPVLEPQAGGTTALLQAVSAVNERIAWVSGHRATVLRTLDGGAAWERLTVTGADSELQFRDVQGFDGATAYLLSAGPGERSRIYRTDDGGRSWRLQFTNRDSSAFFDCFAFWNRTTGIAFSDAVGGRMVALRTTDGEHWERIPAGALPRAQSGEGGFAASGTCVAALGAGRAWIATGAADTARVLRTEDGGVTWAVAATPLPGGRTAGLTTVAFRDPARGIVAGGDIAQAESRTPNVAGTEDGGATWAVLGRTAFSGPVYGVALIPGTDGVVAAGPRGLDFSSDGGRTWATLDTLPYWSVGMVSRNRGWAVGPGGRITRVDLPR